MPPSCPQALFLDRDGTLIRWVDYLCDPEKVELCPGVAAGLVRAKEAGCLLFLHTNQSGVARGLFDLAAVDAVNRRMLDLLGEGTSLFDAVCVATEHPDRAGEAAYRKPNPRFVLEMLEAYQLDPSACYFVGDNCSDVETGLNAGINAVLVRSGLDQECSVPQGVLHSEDLGAFLAALYPEGS